MEQRLQAINHFTVGRTAYFAYADTATPFRELDEWLRRRLRQVRWKEWKRYHNRRRNLRTLSPAPPDCTELRAARAWEVSPEPLSGVSRMRPLWVCEGLAAAMNTGPACLRSAGSSL